MTDLTFNENFKNLSPVHRTISCIKNGYPHQSGELQKWLEHRQEEKRAEREKKRAEEKLKLEIQERERQKKKEEEKQLRLKAQQEKKLKLKLEIQERGRAAKIKDISLSFKNQKGTVPPGSRVTICSSPQQIGLKKFVNLLNFTERSPVFWVPISPREDAPHIKSLYEIYTLFCAKNSYTPYTKGGFHKIFNAFFPEFIFINWCVRGKAAFFVGGFDKKLWDLCKGEKK